MELTKICFECQKDFPKDELIEIKGDLVCASCKPIVIQRIEEFGGPSTILRTAGFGIRFAAFLLDYIIISGFMMFIIIFLSILVFALKMPEFIAPVFLVIYIIYPLYFIYFTGKNGATFGKSLLKIKVVRMDGSSVGYGLAVGRFFAFVLSGMICYIGFILALFDKQYAQALHDKICKTRVVYA